MWTDDPEPAIRRSGRRWVLSLLKAQAQGTSRFDLAMVVKEQNEDPCAGDLLQSTRRLRRILLLERGTSLCVHRARAPSSLAKAVVTRQKSSRLTTCLGAQPSATREAADANHPASCASRRLLVVPVAGEATSGGWTQKVFNCSPLSMFSSSEAMAPPAVSGPLDVAASPAGLGSRAAPQPQSRAGLRSVGDAPRATISSSRAAEPWSRRRAETSDLRVAARLGGRRDIKDIQDAGREAAASRMQREAGRRPRSSAAIVHAIVVAFSPCIGWAKSRQSAPFSAVRILPFSSFPAGQGLFAKDDAVTRQA